VVIQQQQVQIYEVQHYILYLDHTYQVSDISTTVHISCGSCHAIFSKFLTVLRNVLLFMVPCLLRSIARERQEICQDLIASADDDPISLHSVSIGMKCGVSCMIDKCGTVPVDWVEVINIPTEDEMSPRPSLNTGASGGIFQQH
jgi:hypothetical protein